MIIITTMIMLNWQKVTILLCAMWSCTILGYLLQVSEFYSDPETKVLNPYKKFVSRQKISCHVFMCENMFDFY